MTAIIAHHDSPSVGGWGRYLPAGTAACAAVVIILVSTALDAFTFIGVPFQWLGQFFSIVAAVAVFASIPVTNVPGILSLLLLGLWLILTTFFGTISGDVDTRMPPEATTTYGPYVLLRFVGLAAVAATMYLTYVGCTFGDGKKVLRWVSRIGFIVAAYALYAYAAQRIGLPVLEGNRVSSGAEGEIATLFYGGVSRTLGTFREPGELARWLLLPLFAAVAARPRALNIHSATIGLVMLLSLSLTGFLAIAIGVVLAPFFTGPLKWNTARQFVYIVVLAAAALTAIYLAFDSLEFTAYVTSTTGTVHEDTNFLVFTFNRLLDLFKLGAIEGSNRGYIIAYVLDANTPYLGAGLGNANIDFTQGSHKLASFISLYVNIWFAGGLVGIALLLVYLAGPLVAVRQASLRAGRLVFYLTGGYIAWLVAYVAVAEELSVIFAISYVLLTESVRGESAMLQA